MLNVCIVNMHVVRQPMSREDNDRRITKFTGGGGGGEKEEEDQY